MKFIEAEAKMVELAKGKYCAIEIGKHMYSHGAMHTECSLYIDGHGHVTGPTWEDAARKLSYMVEGEPIEVFPELEELVIGGGVIKEDS